MSATASFRLPFIMPRPARANVTPVRSVYADFSRLSKRGGIASYVATHFDADCEYRPVEEATPVRGHAALTRWLRRWLEAWDDAWDEIDELYEADETVVTAIRTHGRGRKSGLEISQRLFDVFELRSGRVVRVTEYLEPGEALAAAGFDPNANAGPASIALCTSARRGSDSNPVRTHVAPAASHGSTSSPGEISTTTSKSSVSPRSPRTSSTSSPSALGSGRSIGKKPSQRTARFTGRRFGQRPATQTGMRGRWTGAGSNSPPQNALSRSRP